MKSAITLAAAAALTVCTLSLQAQDAPVAAKPEGAAPATARDGGAQSNRPRFQNPIVTALDANADGTLDAQEMAAAPEALKKLDKNNDGKLTPDELRPARPAGMDAAGGNRGGDRTNGGANRGGGDRPAATPAVPAANAAPAPANP